MMIKTETEASPPRLRLQPRFITTTQENTSIALEVEYSLKMHSNFQSYLSHIGHIEIPLTKRQTEN